MAEEECGFRVRGRVQGVGFRWWTRRTAEGLGLVGSVRNLPDGSVEVMVRGERSAIDEMAHKLWHGPVSANVDTMERIAAKLRVDATGFTIQP